MGPWNADLWIIDLTYPYLRIHKHVVPKIRRNIPFSLIYILVISLFNIHQLPALLHHLALRAPDSSNHPIRRRAQHRLSLHTLQHDDRLSLLHTLPNLHAYLDHQTRHRRPQRARRRRRPRVSTQFLSPRRRAPEHRRGLRSTENVQPLCTNCTMCHWLRDDCRAPQCASERSGERCRARELGGHVAEVRSRRRDVV